MNLKVISLSLVLITTLNLAESSKILGLFTSQSKSHLIIQIAVAKALVEKGHNVTVVTTLPYNEPNAGYRHIHLKTENKFEKSVRDLIYSNGTLSKIPKFFSVIKSMMDSGSEAIKKKEFQKLMKEESFDLLLLGFIFNDFHLGLAEHFKCPSVLIWVQKPFGVLDRFVGNPLFALDIPRAETFITGNGFTYRLLNFLMNLFELAFYPVYDYIQEIYYRDIFPADKYSSLEAVRSNVSLFLCNHHFSEGLIRPNVPGFIEIGGIQVKPKPDPLPSDIKTFLDNSSKNGAIFFSLGSNAKVEDIGENALAIIYKVLSNLKQNVVWKWDSIKTPGTSNNILFKKWLPQDDILAHKNVRLFITHGGKGSIVESQYHGVPMLGIPLFGDQPMNVKEIVKKGHGIEVDFLTLTEKSFESAVMDVLNISKYKENVKHYSDLYRDRPMTARETATYWIEYVLRHKGARHLQSPAVHLNTIQMLGWDVMAFLAVVLYVVFRIIKFGIMAVWRKCCSRQKKIENIRKPNKKFKTS